MLGAVHGRVIGTPEVYFQEFRISSEINAHEQILLNHNILIIRLLNKRKKNLA